MTTSFTEHFQLPVRITHKKEFDTMNTGEVVLLHLDKGPLIYHSHILEIIKNMTLFSFTKEAHFTKKVFFPLKKMNLKDSKLSQFKYY